MQLITTFNQDKPTHGALASFLRSLVRSFAHAFVKLVHSFVPRSLARSFIYSFVISFIRSFAGSFVVVVFVRCCCFRPCVRPFAYRSLRHSDTSSKKTDSFYLSILPLVPTPPSTVVAS